MRRKNAPGVVFDKVDSGSVADVAVAQVEDLILSGVLREGEMLPGERELAEQFGISRPKVREALHELAERDLLRIVANDGVYVARLGGEVLSPALVALYNRNKYAIRDYLEYRREQEGFASRLAAQRATERDRSELQYILTEMATADANKNSAKASELDLQLHQTIAFAAHNRTLTQMMTALYDLNRSSLFYNRDELLNLKTAGVALFDQHNDIVDAICTGRAAQAEQAAHAHIDFVTSLVDAALVRTDREKLSSKRYRRDA